MDQQSHVLLCFLKRSLIGSRFHALTLVQQRRGHFNLGNLTPGEVADLWIDIGVPVKTASEEKGRERTRDKILGFFVGAKGNQPSDVEGCRVHIQVQRLCNGSLTMRCHVTNYTWQTDVQDPEPICEWHERRAQ